MKLTPKAPSAQKRILLVDDDPALCRLCALVLSEAGYAVETAADGFLGWDAVCANHYDLLITDIEMPRLNGLELAARVRLAGMRLPIVILSGSLDLLETRDTTQIELTEVLQKPIPVPELIRAVECALTQSAVAEEHSHRLPPALLALAHSHSCPSHCGLNE
jgi:DNA-binding response OmpR family regulator